MALCLLASSWAKARGGRIHAVTVDHGLRPEAASEASQVAAWLAVRDINHHTVVWDGAKPATGIEAAARDARYRLLRVWCADHGVLHLLVAHHQDDQAETFLLRLGRGSGVDGLAAMAPRVAFPEAQLLRPLLEIPRVRLAETLRVAGQDWIEDPSNLNERFLRVRLRRTIPTLVGEGLGADRLAATAKSLRRARQALDAATNALMVSAVEIDPIGYAWLDPTILTAVPQEIALRSLAHLCRMIGGSIYPPRLAGLERLFGELGGGRFKRRTFGGCLLTPRRGRVLVCREAAAVLPALAVEGGDDVVWDRRYSLSLRGRGEGEIRALGRAGWQEIRDAVGEKTSIPLSVIDTLPALVDRHGISVVPHLGYKRGGGDDLSVARLFFTPANPVTPV